jgi:hypothetical protein
MESFETYYGNQHLIRRNSAILSDNKAKRIELEQKSDILFRRLEKLQERLQAYRAHFVV